MSIPELVQAEGLESDADAGNWQTIADALNAATRVVNTGPVITKQVFAALGDDARAVVAALDADPIGRAGLASLYAGDLDFSDPVTAGSMADLVSRGVITQATSDTLSGLSEHMESPAQNEGLGTVTASEVQTEWGKHTLRRDYDSGLNVAVNEAYANGDRAGMVVALRALADSLGA